jgi:hypothetical protein
MARILRSLDRKRGSVLGTAMWELKASFATCPTVPLSLWFLLATRRYGIIFQHGESALMERIAVLEPIPNILTTVSAP